MGKSTSTPSARAGTRGCFRCPARRAGGPTCGSSGRCGTGTRTAPPPGVYDKPHFNVHFYIEPIEKVFAIEAGPCCPEHVRRDQFTQVRMPLPANSMHSDFKGVEVVAPAMGNHRVDLKAPEFNGAPSTHTWICGLYEGRVTFCEEMVTIAHLKSLPDGCSPIKKAPAVALAGRYPTLSCIRYRPATSEITVSLEGFEQRAATPPAQQAGPATTAARVRIGAYGTASR